MALVFFLLMFVGIAFTVISLIGILIKVFLVVFKYKENFQIKRITISFVLGLVIAFIGNYYTFFDLQHLPTGELITEVPSPNEEYIFKAYLTNGGATVDFAVRGEVVFTKQGNKTKTIYWNYHEDNADIKWIDNQTVNINGHILNVQKDKYDFRRHLE